MVAMVFPWKLENAASNRYMVWHSDHSSKLPVLCMYTTSNVTVQLVQCVHLIHVHATGQSVSMQCTSCFTVRSCPLCAHCVSGHCSTLYTSCTGLGPVCVDIDNRRYMAWPARMGPKNTISGWPGRLYIMSSAQTCA